MIIARVGCTNPIVIEFVLNRSPCFRWPKHTIQQKKNAYWMSANLSTCSDGRRRRRTEVPRARLSWRDADCSRRTQKTRLRPPPNSWDLGNEFTESLQAMHPLNHDGVKWAAPNFLWAIELPLGLPSDGTVSGKNASSGTPPAGATYSNVRACLTVVPNDEHGFCQDMFGERPKSCTLYTSRMNQACIDLAGNPFSETNQGQNSAFGVLSDWCLDPDRPLNGMAECACVGTSVVPTKGQKSSTYPVPLAGKTSSGESAATYAEARANLMDDHHFAPLSQNIFQNPQIWWRGCSTQGKVAPFQPAMQQNIKLSICTMDLDNLRIYSNDKDKSKIFVTQKCR